MYANGWPGDRSIYTYAAEEVLRYGSKFQQEFKGVIGKEFEKKAKVILDTKDTPAADPSPKNIISVRRNPIEVKSKNSLDLSIFDKPRVQLSRSSKGAEKLRDSRKEEDFLELNFTKPEKKGIVLAENPDFTVDKDYYEQEFQKPPEEDEDLLRFSMKSEHKRLDPDPVVNTSSVLMNDDKDSYHKNEEFDDTHKQSQLMGHMHASQDDGVNIGNDDASNEQYSQDGRQQNSRELESEGEDRRDETIESKERPKTDNSKAKEAEGEDNDKKSSNSRTPNSRISKDRNSKSRASNKSLKSKKSDK